MAQIFNGGNPSVGPQLTDFDLTRIAARESRKSVVFSQLGRQTNMKRNHGDTFKKTRKFPILHEQNINDMGIDGAGVTMDITKWYAYDINGTRTEHGTEADAKASLDMVRVVSGQGNLWGGSRDFFRQVSAVPHLRELGGVVNEVGSKRTIITAKIKLYSLAESFTRQEMELGGEANLKSEKTYPI